MPLSPCIQWDGLANLVRKQDRPLLDFLAANSRYIKFLPDESKEAAALIEVKYLNEPEKSSSSPGFLQLPKNWPLRGVPESFTDPKRTHNERLHLITASSQSKPLPPGWEKRYHSSAHKYYFADHNKRLTSWNDPRGN
jgi:hypothetical protein